MWRAASGCPPGVQSVPAPRWIGPMPAQLASDGSGPKADQPTMPCASRSKHKAPVRRTTTTTGASPPSLRRCPGRAPALRLSLRETISIPKVQVLSLPEQLMLVALDPDRGRLSGSPTVYVAMAGGVVLDLLAGGVAVVQDGKMRIGSPTTATALPGMLQENAVAALSTDGPRDVKHWVRHFAAPRFQLGQQVAAALAQRGLLRIQRERRFGLVPVQRQRLLDRQAREELLATVRRALADAAPPSLRVG